MSFFNQLKSKAEELNKKHNILPIGQNHPSQQQQQQQQQQGNPASPHQNYPGQSQSQYPGYGQQPPPPGSAWQQQKPGYGNYYAPTPSPPIPFHSRPGGGGGGGGSGSSTPSGYGPGPTTNNQQEAAAPPPPPPPPPRIYWRPDFRPDAPVAQAFEHKQGHGDPWGWGNNELQNYTASAANSFYTPPIGSADSRSHPPSSSSSSSSSSGKLIIRAIAQPNHPDPEARFTSARLVSRATLGRPDGCLSATLSLPCADGIWPAFWLLPREPFVWPHEGEIDVAESWNGDCRNHSCLHWGFYTPEDASKHLVRETHVPDMPRRPVRFDFVWRSGGTGPRREEGVKVGGFGSSGVRLMWCVDGRPVMRNLMPAGTRPVEDFCVLLNVAMGGNVCQGKAPREGAYDLVVHDLHMSEAPQGGWGKFEADWQWCPDGAVM